MYETHETQPTLRLSDRLFVRMLVLLAFVGAMWAVRVVDTFRSYDSVLGDGIVPRTVSHLTGIVTAPFIHASWSHLIANTVPLLVLGALVLVGGTGEWLYVTVICAIVGGMGTWIFGEAARHVGASGIIFGYAGYLLARPAFDRRIWSFVITLIVGVLYGAVLLWSIVPRAGVSWSGHAFGFVGGVLAARMRGRAEATEA